MYQSKIKFYVDHALFSESLYSSLVIWANINQKSQDRIYQ